MAFKSSNPLVRDGKVFDLLGVSLITSPTFAENKVEATVVLKLDPYRINGAGEIERPMVLVETEDGQKLVIDHNASKTIVIPDAYSKASKDSALSESLISVSIGIQKFITAKGV